MTHGLLVWGSGPSHTLLEKLLSAIHLCFGILQILRQMKPCNSSQQVCNRVIQNDSANIRKVFKKPCVENLFFVKIVISFHIIILVFPIFIRRREWGHFNGSDFVGLCEMFFFYFKKNDVLFCVVPNLHYLCIGIEPLICYDQPNSQARAYRHRRKHRQRENHAHQATLQTLWMDFQV